MFYSNRFHTENFALIFQALAFLILFKVYLKKEKLSFITPKFSLLWILFFTFLSFFFRQGNLMIIPPLFLFIIILNKSKIFNKKTTPFVLGIFAILVISLFFLPYIKLPESGILSKKGLLSYYHPESNLAWKTISVFYGFYESAITSIPSIFYYAFLLGLLIVLFELFVYTEGIKKILPNNEDLKYKSNLFSIITITLILFYFIFIQRPANYEYRWFFPILFAMLPITAI